MTDSACRQFRDALDDAPLAADVAVHVAACAECARIVARQRALVRLLSASPAAPRVDLRAPALPAGRGGRLLPMSAARWAAAAAAVLLVAAAWRLADRGVGRVRVERVIDVAGAPPQVDERLLALTGGVEAVAMRRPTEIR